jgi:hypothetical protein
LSTAAEQDGSAAGKGRPTPSRREAEQARKQQLKIPKDPKAARKASRERDRSARDRQRQGMMAGDERYLPAADRGPARAFTRDFVDSRITIAEFFIFIAHRRARHGLHPQSADRGLGEHRLLRRSPR